MSLLENRARYAAGGIGLISQSTLHVQSEGITIEGNTAPSGGAVFAQGSGIIVNATAKISDNSAVEGGGCYLSGQSQFFLENEASLQFTNNTASYKGGAMFVEGGQACDFGFPSNSHCLFVVQVIRS